MTTLTGSIAEQTLTVQLEQAGIPFEREYRFHPNRRWRADFVIFIRQWAAANNGRPSFDDPVLVEIDGGGYIGGRHSTGLGIERDAEKASAAAILGYRIIRATPRQVESGQCLEWIRAALGAERGAA